MTRFTSTLDSIASSVASTAWTGIKIVAGLGTAITVAGLAYSCYSSRTSRSSTTRMEDMRVPGAFDTTEDIARINGDSIAEQSQSRDSKPDTSYQHSKISSAGPQFVNTLTIKTGTGINNTLRMQLFPSNGLEISGKEAAAIRQAVRSLYWSAGRNGIEFDGETIVQSVKSTDIGGKTISGNTKVLWEGMGSAT